MTIGSVSTLSQVPTRFDHLVYAVPDLERGVGELAELLGVAPTPGGAHPGRGTRNALVSLGEDRYLEIIGPDPQQPAPPAPRPFGIDRLDRPRLVTWAVKEDRLEKRLRDARQIGLDFLEPAAMSRRRPDRQLLEWRLLVPRRPVAEGVVPFFIDWGQTENPARSAVAGCELQALSARSEEPVRVRFVLGWLGVRLPVSLGSESSLEAKLSTPEGVVVLR